MENEAQADGEARRRERHVARNCRERTYVRSRDRFLWSGTKNSRRWEMPRAGNALPSAVAIVARGYREIFDKRTSRTFREYTVSY